MKKKRIRIEDIEYIEYYPRNELDIRDGYCIIGNPIIVKLKKGELNEESR